MDNAYPTPAEMKEFESLGISKPRKYPLYDMRLYYITPAGVCRTRDFKAPIAGLNRVTYAFAILDQRGKATDRLDNSVLWIGGYMPYRATAIKLVRRLKNGTERVLLRGSKKSRKL